MKEKGTLKYSTVLELAMLNVTFAASFYLTRKPPLKGLSSTPSEEKFEINDDETVKDPSAFF